MILSLLQFYIDPGMMADGLHPPSSMTVAHTLSVISYNIIASPVILAKLQVELAESQSKSNSRLKWSQLEQLPYLVRLGFFTAPPSPLSLLTIFRVRSSKKVSGQYSSNRFVNFFLGRQGPTTYTS